MTNQYKGLREGQAFMTAIHNLNPELYEKITGTDIDPFYDDSKINACMNFIYGLSQKHSSKKS